MCIKKNVIIDKANVTEKSAVGGLNPINEDKLEKIKKIKSPKKYSSNFKKFFPKLFFIKLDIISTIVSKIFWNFLGLSLKFFIIKIFNIIEVKHKIKTIIKELIKLSVNQMFIPKKFIVSST
jgi:hypothetical protein